jgi:hypothetical protein
MYSVINKWGENPVLEFEDNGNNWKIDKNMNIECNGSKTQRITWSGPVVIFRWDNLIDVDIKKVQ